MQSSFTYISVVEDAPSVLWCFELRADEITLHGQL